MKIKAALFATVASAVVVGPAFAQTSPAGVPGQAVAPASASDLEQKIQALQTQLDKFRDLQDQLRNVQQQLDAMKASETLPADAVAKENAAIQLRKDPPAEPTIVIAQNAPPPLAPAAAATTVPLVNFFTYKGVTITLGGFLAFETVYRSRSELGDIGSSFSAIPLPNSPFNHVNEFRETGRQSRVAFLARGDANPVTHLAMYGEFDFLAGPGSANSNESNSYSPRIRHIYGTADFDDLGLHFLAGQNWSLLTLNAVGENPRTELPPPTIDAQYSVGYLWTRQPQFRVVKDFDKELYIGISVENPQTTVNTGLNGSALVTANHVTFNGAGMAGLFSPNTVLSVNHVPDFIGKIALDPDPGHQFHFEIMGMWRDMYDRANFTNHDVGAASFGAGTFIKLIPGSLDIQATAMYGQGIGRYETSTFSDATLRPDGSLAPLTEHTELLGLTWHATPLWDFYVFGGEAAVLKKPYSLNGVQYGYGNSAAVNTGCFSETATGACTANNRQVEQIAIGTWDNVYAGNYGQLRIGVQYSYTKRLTFTGVGGAPSADENMFFTSFRYYPF